MTQTIPQKMTTLVSVLALSTALAACGKAGDDRTAGERLDSSIAATEQKSDELRAESREQMAEARSAVDDAAITTSVNAGLVKDPDLSALRIDVDTKDGVVSLEGTAPSETARDRAIEIARSVKGVVAVENRLTVKAKG
ncbi:MAG: BON domain-containing protein [Burkholderiales bacterium]|nr:BON domain-containing protein [Burkholderiales bacterium]